MKGPEGVERRGEVLSAVVETVREGASPGASRADLDRNVCGGDRLARFVAGSSLLVLALAGRRGRGRPGGEGTVARWQLLATAAGAELLVTGLLQWCPANAALGIDSCAHDWATAVRIALRE